MDGEHDEFTYLYDQSMYAGEQEQEASVSFPSFFEGIGQRVDQQPTTANAFGSASPFPASTAWMQGVELPLMHPNQGTSDLAPSYTANHVADMSFGDWPDFDNSSQGWIDG